MANTQQGDPMLEKFFSAPKTLRRLRGGISGPHIDAFADDLERDGYAPASAVRWNAQALRDFLLERASQCRKQTTKSLIPALRAFLRFLNFRGELRDDLAIAIPAVAHWRLARLPHCLSAEEVGRLIAACDGTAPGRPRDPAIL